MSKTCPVVHFEMPYEDPERVATFYAAAFGWESRQLGPEMGDYVLADIDVVINLLRVTGLNSVPSININLPTSSADASGHGFEPTYLDKNRAAYARTRGMITTSLDALAP